MSIYFFDSSSLVKRYITEVGTQWVVSTIAQSSGNTIVVAPIASTEIVSAAQRRKRNARLIARDAHAIRLRVDRHIEREYVVVELNDVITRRAEDLLEAHILKAADALQLACAIEANSRLGTASQTALTFVCSDVELTRAARAEGLLTDDPNLHP